jgi:hypothetical protein
LYKKKNEETVELMDGGLPRVASLHSLHSLHTVSDNITDIDDAVYNPGYGFDDTDTDEKQNSQLQSIMSTPVSRAIVESTSTNKGHS